jgi:molybdate transport system substrate-binding protein
MRRATSPPRAPLTILAVATLLAGCGGAPGDERGSTLTVFAAASLTDVFEELGARLEAQRPGLEVRFTVAGSSTLAAQLVQGAPADVFASADAEQMQVVTDARIAAEPTVFATNVLTIAVPEGNPAGVTGLADLAREELTVALCAPEVPCGAVAGRLLRAAGVDARPDTLEADARAALTKVELAEVDAALVYVTDAASRPEAVDAIDVPEADAAVNEYSVAVLTDAPEPGAARAFVDLLRSADGRRALADAGFREP